MKKKSEDFIERKTISPISKNDQIKDIQPISQDSRPKLDKSGIKRYYDSFGKLHRLDGPAVITPDGNQLWYQRGKLHREDGPAAVFFNGTQKWFLDGNEISPIEILQFLINKGKISIHDIETLKELAEIAFFDYYKTDIRALKQAGELLKEKGIIVSRNMDIVSQFLKASMKL